MNMDLETRRGLARCSRNYGLDGVEVRAPSEGSTLARFSGHAAATGLGYEMYGGPESGGWMETVEPGAFKRTLGRNPDVAFLLNHGGMTMARTTAGNLRLNEDATGLAVGADLNTERSDVNDLVIAMRDRNITEMSFAFRVTQQQWLNADGDEVDWRDLSGIDRRIQAVDLNQGDVSAVNYGASPFTDASLRSLLEYVDPVEVAELRRMATLVAVAEKRAGATLSAATMAVLTDILDGIAEADDNLDDALEALSTLLGVPNPDLPEGGAEPPEPSDTPMMAFDAELIERQRAYATAGVALRAELL